MDSSSYTGSWHCTPSGEEDDKNVHFVPDVRVFAASLLSKRVSTISRQRLWLWEELCLEKKRCAWNLFDASSILSSNCLLQLDKALCLEFFIMILIWSCIYLEGWETETQLWLCCNFSPFPPKMSVWLNSVDEIYTCPLYIRFLWYGFQ